MTDHRSNIPVESPEDFYLISIFIPLLDHTIRNIKDRFSEHNSKAMNLSPLMSCDINEKTTEIYRNNFEDVFTFWKNVLPKIICIYKLLMVSGVYGTLFGLSNPLLQDMQCYRCLK